MKTWHIAAIVVLAVLLLAWLYSRTRNRSVGSARTSIPSEGNSGMIDKNHELIALSENPDTRLWKVDFEDLSDAERVFVAIWELEAQVNNGGFDQYYYNSSGDTAFAVVGALENIGARQMAAIVRQANAVFPDGQPSSTQEKRHQQLDALSDESKAVWKQLDENFFDYPDDLTELLYDFVQKYRDQIQGA